MRACVAEKWVQGSASCFLADTSYTCTAPLASKIRHAGHLLMCHHSRSVVSKREIQRELMRLSREAVVVGRVEGPEAQAPFPHAMSRLTSNPPTVRQRLNHMCWALLYDCKWCACGRRALKERQALMNIYGDLRGAESLRARHVLVTLRGILMVFLVESLIYVAYVPAES